MKNDKKKYIDALLKKIPLLTVGQLLWLDRVVQIFESPYMFSILHRSLFGKKIINDFGDALRIHHSFSVEPFSKDKFEYVLEKVLTMNNIDARLAPKGNRGHDIVIGGIPVSLKTQANKDINEDKIWISKFMELGKGKWGDNPKDLVLLRRMYLEHLKGYKKIFILRALARGPDWHYELVEIPMKIMRAAARGELEMRLESRQFPKPGYCHVSLDDEKIYQLYFDAGSERKLQVKNLLKSYCVVHADWKFTIPPEEGLPEQQTSFFGQS